MIKFAKSVIAALSLSALPATAFAAPLTPLATSAQAYDTLYTESSWMNLRVPIAQLGGVLPSNLNLSASNLPSGTSITLLGAAVDGSEAVLTVSVQRSDITTAVNATSLITLSSGNQMLTSFNVPVVGVAYDASF